jgi:hypothetical protein
MKALTVFVRGGGCLALCLLASATASGQAAGVDPLGRARQAYNAGQYDQAIVAAQDAASRPGTRSEASLLLGRALLERHRATATPDDLTAAREAFRRVEAGALSDRGRLDFVVGLGEALYLAEQYRAAAGVIEPALEQLGLLGATAREQVVDWWATAMDRHAQTRESDARAAIYEAMTERLRLHLGRYPGSSAASYWLPAAALARGDLDLAWDLALAGWVRSPLAPDQGVALRADLERLVTQALIPERVKRLPDAPDSGGAAARLAAEWDALTAPWAR